MTLCYSVISEWRKNTKFGSFRKEKLVRVISKLKLRYHNELTAIEQITIITAKMNVMKVTAPQ